MPPLPQISSLAWEHPADRAALNTLRALPGFDEVVRRVAGGEAGSKPARGRERGVGGIDEAEFLRRGGGEANGSTGG